MIALDTGTIDPREMPRIALPGFAFIAFTPAEIEQPRYVLFSFLRINLTVVTCVYRV